MMSTKYSDFLTPSPLSTFGTDLYYKIHATSLSMSAFQWPPPPPMRTSYLEAPLSGTKRESSVWPLIAGMETTTSPELLSSIGTWFSRFRQPTDADILHHTSKYTLWQKWIHLGLKGIIRNPCMPNFRSHRSTVWLWHHFFHLHPNGTMFCSIWGRINSGAGGRALSSIPLQFYTVQQRLSLIKLN